MQYSSKVVCLYSNPNTAQINPSAARKPRSQIGDVKEKQSKIGYESLHISRRHPIHRIHPKSSNAHRRILKSQRLLWSSKVAHEPESWMFWNVDILCIACTNIKTAPKICLRIHLHRFPNKHNNYRLPPLIGYINGGQTDAVPGTTLSESDAV